jgi:uncharacterized protein YebE (UPF0316 family)
MNRSTTTDHVIVFITAGSTDEAAAIARSLVEERLAIGHVQLQIVSRRHGTALARALRQGGFGVTEISARGRDGTVRLLTASVLRKDVAHAKRIVRETDTEAFITSENVTLVRRGFWRA